MSLEPFLILLTSRAKFRTFTPLRNSQLKLRRNFLTYRWDTTRRAACRPRAAITWATHLTQMATRLVISNSCRLSREVEATWTWWTCSIWITPSITTLLRSARQPTQWKPKTNSSEAKRRTHLHSIRASTWRTRRHPLRLSSKTRARKVKRDCLLSSTPTRKAKSTKSLSKPRTSNELASANEEKRCPDNMRKAGWPNIRPCETTLGSHTT